MKNALLKTFVLAMAVAGIISLTGCKEANSAPASSPTASNGNTPQNNTDTKAPAAADANGRKAEEGSELY